MEKKQNISASNNYFDKKKEKYAKSKIAICKRYANSPLRDWNLDSITNNDQIIRAQVIQLFQQWIEDYEPTPADAPKPSTPTPEERALIEEFRKRGLIK